MCMYYNKNLHMRSFYYLTSKKIFQCVASREIQKQEIYGIPSLTRKCLSIYLSNKLSYNFIESKVKMSMKPKEINIPNILVYTGCQQESVYKNIADVLTQQLHPHKYIVYELKNAQVIKDPWKDNVTLLVIASPEIDKDIAKCFRNYFRTGGKIMILNSNIDIPEAHLSCKICWDDMISDNDSIQINFETHENATVSRGGKFSYILKDSMTLVVDMANKPIVQYVKDGSILLVSDIDLFLKPADSQNVCMSILKRILGDVFNLEVHSETLPVCTAGYILTETFEESFELMKNITIKNIPVSSPQSSSEKPEETVPLLLESQILTSVPFDKAAYYSKLKSKKFGRVVLFFSVITSTMIPSGYLSYWKNLVVVASRQLCGSGRVGNAWLSPEGCAMFTLNFSLSLSSPLGKRLSVLQNMAVLAVVFGIKKIPGYDILDLRIKWPNDLYIGKDSKIGGVLVKTTIQANLAQIFVGIGINVSNDRPTTCINATIRDLNVIHGSSLSDIKVEEVIAITLTELEYIIELFEKSGPEEFLKLYYKYWMHDNQQVTLSSIGENAIIKGLDDYGFLIVETKSGKRMTLQPDGNTFDMLKNLIVAKE